MSALREKRIPIEYTPGMHPVPDSTPLSTTRIIDGDRIRWEGGRLEQIGGWVAVKFDQLGENQSIEGCARMLFSFITGNNYWYLVGTSLNLYALLNNGLTNITPLVTSTTPIGTDDLSTVFDTSTDPFDMTIGSIFVTIFSGVDISNSYAGQSIQVTGATGTVLGVPSAQLNGVHTILYYSGGFPVISVTTAATSTGTAGGAGIDTATQGIIVLDIAHGLSTGQRIKIAGATTFAGIPAGDINAEHIITVIDDDYYYLNVPTLPTSSAAGGGAAITRQEQIDSGECDNAPGVGYGMGLYGVGLYGVSKNAYLPGSIKELRIWSADRFGGNVVMTPGNQTPIYQWAVDTDTAPVALSTGTPPSAVNYVFTTDNFVCCLGPDGVENKVQWADQGVTNQWVPDADNLAGSNTLFDSGRLISQINVRGTNLIFSQNLIYTMRFVEGSPYVFQFQKMDAADGIIAQNARVSHKGIAYWIGNNGFYKYDGGMVREIGDLSDNDYVTIKQYFFSRLTTNQRQKICAGVVRQYNEVWWFYPSQDSQNEHGYNENDSYLIYNTADGWWAYGSLARTAIEYPGTIGNNQYMIGANNTVYSHELGVNDDTSPMNAFADIRIVMAGTGDDYLEITGFMADAIITGDMKVTYFTKRFPQSPDETVKGPYTVTATSDLKRLRAYGRQRKVRVETDTLGSSFKMGQWYEYAKTGGQR